VRLGCLDQFVQLLLVYLEPLVQFEDVLSQPNGLGPGDGQGQFFFPRPPPETFEVWEAGRALRASAPRLLLRSRALSALTDRVRSALMVPPAVIRILMPSSRAPVITARIA